MSLRITNPATSARTVAQGDGWPSRLAKLIPAEALGLYGAGQALVPAERNDGRLVLAVAALLFAGALRYVATRDPQTGLPQWPAVAIAMISFALWVLALRVPAGPFDLGENSFYAALFALLWGTVVPAFYKGD
jgi:hypothetical protein